MIKLKNIKSIILIILLFLTTNCSKNSVMKPEDFKNKEPRLIIENYLESYFKTIKNNLSDDGKAAIQAITIDDNMFDRYRTKKDFIQKYIFPGGFLPSKSIINKYVSENDLTIKSYNSYADHYSDTLAIWKNEFNHKSF